MTDVIPIRGHTLLCLQGFRGRGYSDGFIEEMRTVHRTLGAHPETLVRVLASPDRVCSACPNLATEGCTLGGPSHEEHMRRQDRDVLARLAIPEDGILPWLEVLRRIAGAVRGTDLPAICTTCPWLSLGWCAEGIEALRR